MALFVDHRVTRGSGTHPFSFEADIPPHSPGDLLLLQVSTHFSVTLGVSDSLVPAPAGWAFFENPGTYSQSPPKLRTFSKYGAGETTVTVSHANFPGNSHSLAVVSAFSGVSATDFTDQLESGTGSTSPATSVTAPGTNGSPWDNPAVGPVFDFDVFIASILSGDGISEVLQTEAPDGGPAPVILYQEQISFTAGRIGRAMMVAAEDVGVSNRVMRWVHSHVSGLSTRWRASGGAYLSSGGVPSAREEGWGVLF